MLGRLGLLKTKTPYRLYSTSSALIQEWEGQSKGHIESTYDTISPSRLNLLANTFPDVSFEYKNQVFPDMQTPVPPGWHSAYFPDRSPESQLGADGYESHFHPPDPFTGRLWAGAKMDWNHLNRLKVGDQAVMYSFLEKAELKKSRLGESAMVWSVKDIYNQDGWAMRERRCLVFLPEQNEPNIATKEIKVQEKPDFSASLVPSSILLFRYSALTFNSHKIHFDNDYATKVEKHPACLVHGPLSATLLLNLLSQNMKKDQTLFSFDYKCIAPLYVNQPMTLHGKMTENGCDLWILNDKDNLAVKGSAKFSLYLHEDKNKQTL